MTPPQQELVDRGRALLESDSRIGAAWLSGSLATGSGDAWSDVDLVALVDDGAVANVSAALQARVGEVAQPLLVGALFGGVVINVVAEGWRRFDIALIDSTGLARYDPATLTELFNRTGAQPSGALPAGYRPAPAALLAAVNEFLRVAGLTPVGIGRGDWVTLASGLELQRRALFDLYLDANGVGPWARGGMLSRAKLLTAEQRTAFDALPIAGADRTSVIAANEAIAALYLPLAKRLAAEAGTTWPEVFEAATREHLRQTLGMRI